ncbi:hypothetical protein R1sor_016786 [Riccia sorocarpa]|uniref:Uncharacterized protein n=1 Tax=Riccia sorocarpa TaxID=122646 RepID=A0ABD3HJC1_9MARC
MFINFVSTLNNNATSCVRINIAATNLFPISKSWGKSKARWISAQNPILPWMAELDWVWGRDNETKKLLRFQFKDGLDEEVIYQLALQKIKIMLNSPTAQSTTVHGRIVIVNHLIYGIVWFLLPLWARGKDKIRNLEMMVLKYVWGGDETTNKRHKVAEEILHQRKSDGGMELMSLQAQTQAFAAKTVPWAYTPGTHPLKSWMLANFDAIAKTRWGSSHTWLTTPSRGK